MIPLWILLVLVLWAGGLFAVGGAASARGRNPVAWFALALLISPLLAAIVLVAYPPRFEAEGLYKGIPYRHRAQTYGAPQSGNKIEAMLSGGVVTFRTMEQFTTAIDGGTIDPKAQPN
jgi:hypothetical protein